MRLDCSIPKAPICTIFFFHEACKVACATSPIATNLHAIINLSYKDPSHKNPLRQAFPQIFTRDYNLLGQWLNGLNFFGMGSHGPGSSYVLESKLP